MLSACDGRGALAAHAIDDGADAAGGNFDGVRTRAFCRRRFRGDDATIPGRAAGPRRYVNTVKIISDGVCASTIPSYRFQRHGLHLLAFFYRWL